MKCQKCGIEIEPENYTDLIRIEGHHLHPKVLDNPQGLGEIIDLCRDCHIEELHPLILEIVKKYSYKLKHTNGIYSEWKFVFPKNRDKCINEVIEFTKTWLKENDTKTITQS